ncbi:MAG: DUF4256 domain-containing protein [Chitinophagales bacterium]|nr:DUF4256 domain-containing protein [Chitinophagales bacterium]
MHRHKELLWEDVEKKLIQQEDKLWSLYQMEETGGEPDIIHFDTKRHTYTFCDALQKALKDEEVFAMTAKPWRNVKNTNLKMM